MKIFLGFNKVYIILFYRYYFHVSSNLEHSLTTNCASCAIPKRWIIFCLILFRDLVCSLCIARHREFTHPFFFVIDDILFYLKIIWLKSANRIRNISKLRVSVAAGDSLNGKMFWAKFVTASRIVFIRSLYFHPLVSIESCSAFLIHFLPNRHFHDIWLNFPIL